MKASMGFLRPAASSMPSSSARRSRRRRWRTSCASNFHVVLPFSSTTLFQRSPTMRRPECCSAYRFSDCPSSWTLLNDVGARRCAHSSGGSRPSTKKYVNNAMPSRHAAARPSKDGDAVATVAAGNEADGEIDTIAFIDTPGHQVFSGMRAVATDGADVALLVGVRPY